MSERLSWTERFGYGLGDVGSNLAWGMAITFLLFFYTDVLGISAAAAGTLLLTARLFDALNDPLMGLVTERVRTCHGKFRHYLLYGAPALSVMMVLCFLAPELSPAGRLVYAYVTYFGLGVAFTVVALPYGALASVMTQDPGERNLLSAFRSFGAMLGGGVIVGYGVPVLREKLGGGDEAAGFRGAAAVLAVASLICMWITFWTCRERHVSPPGRRAALPAIAASLRVNTPFLLMAVIVLLVVSAGFIRMSSAVYYATYGLGDAGLVGPYLLAGTLGTLAGIVVSTPAGRRLGKRGAYAAGIVLAVLAGLGQYLTPFHAVVVQLTWYVAASFGGGASFGVMWSLFADTVEYGEWASGTRSEGVIYSVASFVIKLSAAAAGFLPAYVLSATGYAPGAAQPPAVLEGIKWNMTLVPGALKLIALVPLWFHQLDEQRFAAVLADLDQRPGGSGPAKSKR